MNRKTLTFNEIDAQLHKERMEAELAKVVDPLERETIRAKYLAAEKAGMKAGKAAIDKALQSTAKKRNPSSVARFGKMLGYYAIPKLNKHLERYYKKISEGKALDGGKFEAMIKYTLRKNIAPNRIKAVSNWIIKILSIPTVKNVVGMNIVNPKDMTNVEDSTFLTTVGVLNRFGYKDELLMAHLYFAILTYYNKHNTMYCICKLESAESINNYILNNILFSSDLSMYEFMKQFDFDNKKLTRAILRREFKYNTNYLTITFNPYGDSRQQNLNPFFIFKI